MTTAKVLVSDKLSDSGLAFLKGCGVAFDYKPGLKEDDLAAAIGDYEGLVIRSGSKVTAKVLAKATKLKVVGRAGIGVDNVDVPEASKRGIIVMNTPTGNSVTTAEHAITLLMSLARKVPQATASMKAGAWEKTKFQGKEIAGKTLGIIGLGTIGRIVADRAQGLKMNVIAFDPVLTADKAASLGIELVSVDQLLERADCITIHAPLTPDTKNLLGESAFNKVKKGLLLVNAARGGIVDEVALAKAITDGKVAGAALDVFSKEPIEPENPLLKLDEVILTPHLGASTDEAQDRVALEICEQVVEYLKDGTIRNAINVPALPGEAQKKVEPYLGLAKRLGKLLAQLEKLDLTEVRVLCSDEPGELGVRPIVNAALAGYLELFSDDPVNPVSAPFLAKERGIKVVEERVQGQGNTVTLTITGKNGSHSARGRISGSGESRLLHLDGTDLDTILEGFQLVIRNDDKPGVIGAIGSVLGKREINVSRMQVGLESGSKKAVAFWSVNQPVSAEALAELRQIPGMTSVLLVDL